MATLDPHSFARRRLVARRGGAFVALAVVALFGCSNQQGDHGSGSPETSECSGEFDSYEPGMSRQAEPGELTVELVESQPAPPSVSKDSAWWLRLSDADGAPLLGAELLVTPFMPAHQHGSAEVVVEALADGEYKLSPIELSMPGVWEIPVSITPPDGETSETTFRFCLAER